MYYVIIKQENNPSSHFFGFLAQKYLAAKNTDNIIFEVLKDGKTIRKWIDKKEIILLTEDKAYFVELMYQFKEVEAQQLKLINEAQQNLEDSIENYKQVLQEELSSFEKIRDNDDIPCLLKGI